MREEITDLNNLMVKVVLENPYPLYHKLQATDPVHFNPNLNAWLLTRYSDVKSALTDPRFSARPAIAPNFSRPAGEGEQTTARRAASYTALSMLNMDPPEHTRQRTLLTKSFTPHLVEQMRQHIQTLVDEFLDRVQGRGQIEVIEELAYPLPLTVIFELLGLPLVGRDYIKECLAVITEMSAANAPNPTLMTKLAKSLEKVEEYLRPIVTERRQKPGDDLLSALVMAEERGDVLSEQEIFVVCVQLLFAGHETTANLIGNGLLALLQNPAELEKLRANPSLITSAVEELLRYDNASQFRPRLLTEAVEIGGKTLQKGDRVLLMLGAANRDEAQFSQPDRLNIERQEGRALSFGHGIHYCLGAALARLEIQIAINTVLARLPNLKLAVPADQLEHGPSFILRGLKALPLTFAA